MIHLYHGDGKGKTTAACGLALRAAGSGMTVLFVQFFKSGSSSEVAAMQAIPNIETRHPSVHRGRYKQLDDEKRAEVSDSYHTLLTEVIESAENYDMIILDEVVSAYTYGMIDSTQLVNFLQSEGQTRELVMTGRNPATELIELSDYVTEMKKVKHPYDRGVTARKGIEY